MSMEKVVVTGGASFIGSHLVERLLTIGHRVTVIDDLSSGKKEYLDINSPDFQFIEGDLRDSSCAIQNISGADYVYHLANIHGGRGFIETHPGEIAQNFLIDGNVFRAAQLTQAGVCYTSSACAYPVDLQTANSKDATRYLEESMANPFVKGGSNADGVYGWAKFMGELALKSYHEQFGIQGVSCRLFTVYGPRENESHAIIAFIARALLRQDPYVIWGSGTQDRNFTYVDDVVTGLIKAATEIHDCTPINIGTSEITTIFDAAKTVCELLNFSPFSFEFDTTKPEGVNARAASVAMQVEKLHWQPETTFREGIAKTIDWYANQVKLSELEKQFELKLFER